MHTFRTVWGPGTRSRLYNSTGFFFLAWASHYLPFYLMGRQLFLHHYLPAHLASALVTGALVEFVVNVDPVVAPIEGGKAATVTKNTSEQALQPRERLGESSVLATWAAAGLVLTLVIGGWYFFLPLTYGKPGLSVEQVVARKWMGYDLHFAK
jgi:dolichyl-phosphate-mannose-protein mannosyltransferase